MNITCFKEVTSTNDLLLEKAANAPKASDEAVLAFSQTGGKGRRGRSFFSPPSTGLYLSLLLHPEMDVTKSMYITTMMAVAAAQALEKAGSAPVGIKWVNDLYVNDRKIAGILTECSGTFTCGRPDYVVVGIGINLFDPIEGLPEDIKDKAGSVFGPAPSSSDGQTGDEFRRKLAEDIIVGFEYYYQKADEKAWFEDYADRMFLKGRWVVSFDNDNHTEKLKVAGVDEEFGLVVLDQAENQKILRCGEVSLKI